MKGLHDGFLGRSSLIQIVVNTLVGYLPRKPLTDVSERERDQMMNNNLKAAFLVTREALRRMGSQSYGRIMHTSVMIAVRPLPERIPYAVSKASDSLLTELVA